MRWSGSPRPRTLLRQSGLLLIGLLGGACGAGPAAPGSTAPTSPLAASPTAGELRPSGSLASPSGSAPVCFDRRPPWVDRAASVQDGPDPAGRIVFGQEIRMDDVLGQVVGPLFAIDPDGSDLIQIIGCEVERPRFSPDGTRLAFSIAMDDGTWQVATSAPDGTDLRIITHVDGLAETPDWGPDGTWLIYALGDRPCDPWPDCIETGGFQYTLWRMNADGSDQHLVGDPEGIDWEPRISPDGRDVVFSRFVLSEDLRPTIVVRNLESGTELRLPYDDEEAPEHPDWSRDGAFIVYNSYWEAGGLQQVKRVLANDATAAPVVLYGDHGQDGFKPAYSPDGSKIVFGCGAAMCLMDSDGSHVVKLVEAAGVYFNHFTWGVNPP